MQSGMVSNNIFFAEKSRLQQGTNDKRDIVARRQGANVEIWKLDNVGPWDYLLTTNSDDCDPENYDDLDEFEKAAKFNSCIADYEAADGVLFDPSIDDSPRFAWAPQYWYQLPTTGLSWEPVHSYRMVFIAGTWFNCNAGSCGVTFYPDREQTTPLCHSSGPSNCTQLNMSQFSAWVLPNSAVPDEVRNSFPGGQTPVLPTLWR
jgi:hypothetical protein